ncbi:ATP-binding cassette domain-containing protein [Nonomuraea sp. NPDC050394]|uniref:ATP-binding cassette domain-containing protein n=1 Tax=Nonomuraea sp. NPDC050394 TaxID=3364363 RepID=UPI0037ADEF5C
MTTALRLRAVCAGYPPRRGRPGRRVLEHLDASAEPGELTVLIGPNGSGKSTLLRTMAGLQPALAGEVLLGHNVIGSIPLADLARLLAIVLTERDLPSLLSAREVAGLGRHPYTGFTGRLSPADHAVVAWALDAVHAAHLAERPVSELSDGERQRVLIARALAQEPSAILLDEPTAFLDVTARVALMGLLRALARERGLAIVVSTHDLELALRVADRVWLVGAKGTLHTGTPEELTEQGLIGESFDGDELAFDRRTGVFMLRPADARTVRMPADPLLERALAREGWRADAAGPALLAIDRTEDGYAAAFDGHTHRFSGIAELAAWARRAGAEPGLLPADPTVVAEAAAEVSAVGGYFELETAPGTDGWRPFSDLFTDPSALAERIASVAERLGTAETRVAASILFQGLAARLWSPVLGAAIARDLLLELRDPYWRPSPSGPLPLRLPSPTGWHVADPGRLAGPIYRNVVGDLLEPLADTVRGLVKLAPGLLWGNAASSLAGTVRALARHQPELTAHAVSLGRELLDIGVLRETGELAEPAPGQPFFVRRSCCLYYRLPDGGKCGDCALVPDHTRREQWARQIGDAS